MKKHEKHAKLPKADIGFYHKNELAFLGASCGLIAKLVDDLLLQLSDKLQITYIDADHASATERTFSKNILQDKISHKRVEKRTLAAFEQKFLLADQDLVLVNGNHFEAQHQVVIISPEKEASLKKRKNQLTHIKALIIAEGDPYPWLETPPDIPVFQLHKTGPLAEWLAAQIAIPPLKGLILSGGQSLRMGENKALLAYHGQPQYVHLAEMLESLKVPTVVSCKDSQKDQFGTSPQLIDTFTDLGPYGALLSAFQSQPNVAWLVVACDLPLLKKINFERLIASRNPHKLATAFYNPATELPDPLFTIWEPRAYPVLLSFLSLGYSCPRKVLIQAQIELVKVDNTDFLTNANSPEEKIWVQQQLRLNKQT